jgi:lipase chaperone LimK
MLAGMVGGKTAAPTIDMKATGKAAILKAMSDSFDYAIAVANEFNNTTIQETVQARFLGPSTRARVLFFANAHSQDIYGQLAVYLRLNGIVPPASQRP